MLHGFTGTRAAVQFTSNAPADSPVRTSLQHRGRFLRPRRFTTMRTICPFAPAYNATDDSPVRPRGRFTCLRQLTTPWPTRCPRRLTKVTSDSPVHTGLPRRGRFTREGLQLHLAIINFMAHYFRPGTSGDIHLKYIYWYILFFIKEQFIFVLVCSSVDAGQLFTTSKRCG